MIGEDDGRPIADLTCVRNEVIRSCHEIRSVYFATLAIPSASPQVGAAAAISIRFLADANNAQWVKQVCHFIPIDIIKFLTAAVMLEPTRFPAKG